MRIAGKELLRFLLPRKARRYRIRGGPLKGYSIVTSFHDYPAAILGRTEGDLATWFSEHASEGQTWLDVGAHYGYTALLLSRLVGKSGRVVAFEPIIQTAAFMLQTIRLNHLENVDVVPFALSADGVLTHSLVPTVRGMADHTSAGKFSNVINGVSWDALAPVFGLARRVDGVKIDVQGMEIQVLAGMLDLLKADRPMLVVELHEGVDRGELGRLLASAGYEMTGCSLSSGIPSSTLDDNQSFVFAPT